MIFPFRRIKNGHVGMRRLLICATVAASLAAISDASFAAVKQIAYPAIKVDIAQEHKPDDAMNKMRKAFADAVTKKDSNALFALVGPSFVWLAQGSISDEFDFGRDGLHNFKVVFGFREPGKDADGPVQDGPFWDVLAVFASDETFDKAGSTLVCGPTTAAISDQAAFENSSKRMGADDTVEWYFTMTDVTATANPGGGAPIGKAAAAIAMPVLNAYPPVVEGQPAKPVTYLQVLLPVGKSGWVPVSAVRPLVSDRLCYALGSDGTWKIVAFDQAR
jgi:hypothetical protein